VKDIADGFKQRTALEETKKVFPPLRQRIADAVAKLEDQIEVGEENAAPAEEISKAKDTVANAKAALNESA
jgi:tubulin-specific chaperone A